MRPQRLYYKLSSWFRLLLHRRELDQALDDELQFHLDAKIEQNISRGMTPEQARRAARIELGGVEQVKEQIRSARVGAWPEAFVQDIRFGLRILCKAPGFTAAAVLLLALGIGANTAIFTNIDAVLLHPLPYPGADRIVEITRHVNGSFNVPMFIYWEQNDTGLEDLTAIQAGIGSNFVYRKDKPELVEGMKVSRNYFRLFGASLILGRTFSAQEDQPGGRAVVVISYGLWQRALSRDPATLDKVVTIGGAPYTIIGVLSPGFRSYPPSDIWMPLQADPNSTNQAHYLMVAGRLPAGTAMAQSSARMRAIGKAYVIGHGLTLGGDDDLQVTPMREALTGDVRMALLTLQGAVGLVLLMVCANIASLLLARADARQKEIAVRAAMGAGRGRMLRQLLTESLLLACAGGLLGLAVGSWGVRALLALEAGALPRAQDIAPIPALDPWVAGFAALLALATAVLFGLWPAARLSRPDLAWAFKESGGQAGMGIRHRRAHSVFVAGQVAVAVVLLCGAVLLMRSFVAMHEVSLGFDPSNVLTAETSLAGAEYSNSANVDGLARRTVSEIEAMPGVESAALASTLPLRGTQDMIFDIPDRPGAGTHKFLGDVQWRIVSPDYFRVLRIPLLSGRLLSEREPGRTALISEFMARKYWPGADPVGQTMVIGPGLGALSEGLVQIVGVVGDVRERLDGSSWSVIYQTPIQIPDAAMALVNGLSREAVIVRTRPGVPPMSIGPTVRTKLEVSEGLAATKLRTMDQVAMDSTARQNFTLLLFGVFAGIALLLAAIGTFAVVSYLVGQRRHEIGIRIALGAARSHIMRDVLGQSARMALPGIGFGFAAALGLTRLLRSMLFGVSARDPLTFGVVVAVLVAVALLASAIPARKALRVDPMVTLRHE